MSKISPDSLMKQSPSTIKFYMDEFLVDYPTATLEDTLRFAELCAYDFSHAILHFDSVDTSSAIVEAALLVSDAIRETFFSGAD